MSKKECIKRLEAEIEELRARIKLLETQTAPQPIQPAIPTFSPSWHRSSVVTHSDRAKECQ